VGGTLDIDSRPGKGTSVVLEIPAEPAAAPPPAEEVHEHVLDRSAAL
jgi:hypothetical protein